MAMTSTAEIREDIEQFRKRLEAGIREHRGWYMFQGAVFVLAGMLAVILPNATAIGFELLIGALLLVSGAVQGVASLRSSMHWWSLLSALLSIVVGLLLLFNPMAGTIALATVLAVFLSIEGIVEIFLSLQYRPMRNWGWLLASGMVSLLLAALLFAGWPEITVLFMGIIIGINLIIYGAALLALVASAPTRES